MGRQGGGLACAGPGLGAAYGVRAAGFPGGFNLFLRPDVGLGLLQVHLGAGHPALMLFG